MTSFTAASGPLDDVKRAQELLAGAADAMRRLETRARLAEEEDIASASYHSAADIGTVHAMLFDAIQRLRELESLILGRDPRDGREIGR